MFDLDLERVLGEIREKGYRQIGLQFPEGLKERGLEAAREIEEATGCLAVLSADPCYGACDLVDREMEALGVEALVHFGHTPLPEKATLPVLFVPVRMEGDPLPLLSPLLERLRGKRVGLVTTAQHLALLPKAKAYLEGEGIEVAVGPPGGRTVHPGQVLGCSFHAARAVSDRVDLFLYLGSGDFHPLGVALATGRPTLAVDPYLGEIREMGPLRERVLRQRHARIATAMEAGSFGILIGARKGQARKGLAVRLREKLLAHGKEAYLLYCREITPEALLPFRRLDAFVNTACPRIPIDDAGRYKKPILTPPELEIVLGERSWEAYRMDEMEG
jgi:2-(3-amino-3-carboxypropyl)histidine synthase